MNGFVILRTDGWDGFMGVFFGTLGVNLGVFCFYCYILAFPFFCNSCEIPSVFRVHVVLYSWKIVHYMVGEILNQGRRSFFLVFLNFFFWRSTLLAKQSTSSPAHHFDLSSAWWLKLAGSVQKRGGAGNATDIINYHSNFLFGTKSITNNHSYSRIG